MWAPGITRHYLTLCYDLPRHIRDANVHQGRLVGRMTNDAVTRAERVGKLAICLTWGSRRASVYNANMIPDRVDDLGNKCRTIPLTANFNRQYLAATKI